MPTTTTVALERLGLLLTAVAVEPALGGVLVLDAEPGLVAPLTRWFADRVGDGRGTAAPVLPLGGGTRDEDVWAAPRPDAEPPHHWRLSPGPLVEAELAPGPAPVVVVPDLARLSVAGLRAAIQIVGAEETVVEHAGVSLRFRPRSRWLAFCESSELQTVPRHVLDRFVLRTSALEVLPGDLALLPAPRTDGRTSPTPCPAVTGRAVHHLAERLGGAASARRMLVGARLARVLAVGDGSPQADLVHARRAAHAMGLADLSPAGDETPPEPAAYTPPPVPRRRPPGERIADPDGSTAPVTPVHAPAGLRSLPSAPLTPWEPYPDQTDGGEPDPADGTLSRLRLPQGSPGGRRRSPGRGPSIGLVQAHTLRDLSVVGSLLRAARFRPLRSPDGGPLAVEPQDLREHLRAPLPDRYLALLLDHTARDGADWTPDLDPFLRWAYTRRAGLLVVEVGARDAVSELRAEAFTVRSVLHPALAAALRRPPGRATPLAHGVALLARQIRRALSRQGSALTEIHAVIATDGRANVPLRAALQDRAPDRAVGASAVKDAHAQAAVLGEQDPTRFRPFLLAPPGHGGRRLVQDLAARMGATVLPARGEGRGR